LSKFSKGAVSEQDQWCKQSHLDLFTQTKYWIFEIDSNYNTPTVWFCNATMKQKRASCCIWEQRT